MSLYSCCFEIKWYPFYLCVLNLDFSNSLTEDDFFCKCIYCWQNGFFSSVLVLQVLTARFGLIRPAAGSSPVCLKTDPRRKIDPRDLKQQDSRWERSTSFVFGIAYMSLCISAHMTQSNLIKWLLKRLQSDFDLTLNLSLKWKREEGQWWGFGSLLTPRSRQLWPIANCLTTFLSHKLSHVRPWPETAPPWATYSPEAGVRFFEMARSKVLGASEKRGSFSFAIEQFYFRPSWPG